MPKKVSLQYITANFTEVKHKGNFLKYVREVAVCFQGSATGLHNRFLSRYAKSYEKMQRQPKSQKNIQSALRTFSSWNNTILDELGGHRRKKKKKKEEILQMNESDNQIWQDLWNTTKTVLRGKLIVTTVYIKRGERAELRCDGNRHHQQCQHSTCVLAYVLAVLVLSHHPADGLGRTLEYGSVWAIASHTGDPTSGFNLGQYWLLGPSKK